MAHDESPVTAAQLEQILQGALRPMKEDIIRDFQITIAQERLKTDSQFEWLREGIDQTLILLGNIEKRSETKIDNHEHRIKRLEKKVGFTQIAA